jgi:uncharacterized Zn-finger protein/subtilisin-like proprotein convertase family protein
MMPNICCQGVCDDPDMDEGATPCYSLVLPGPDASVMQTISGFGSCCTAVPDNQNCAQITLTLAPNTAGIDIDFSSNPSPCSNDLYDITDGNCPTSQMEALELCDPYCPDIPIGGGILSILICKPGAFVDLEMVVTAIPAVIVNTPNSNDNDGCSVEFSIFGIDPADPVIWDPTTYLTCNDAECHNPTFEYTGPEVTDCAGLDLDYTVTLPATLCSPIRDTTFTVTVFPTIEGQMDVVCGMGQLTFVFTPDLNCPDLVYEWYDENGFLLAETSNSLTVPENLQEYCLQVSRAGATACTPFEVCRIANCCQPPEFLNCPGDRIVTVLDPSCAQITFPTPVANDGGCGPVTVVQTAGPASGSNFPLGPNLIVFTATNADGQMSTCSFIINVFQSPDLTLICPTDIILCSTPGTCNWISSGLDPFTTPDCPPGSGTLVLTHNVSGATTVPSTPGPANGISFNIGTSFVTYTLVNTATGDSEICVFGVTVNDCEAPIITCPTDTTTVECGTEDILAWLNSSSALDVANCSVATVEYFLQVSTELCGEAQLDQYLFIATDGSGNTSDCVAFYGSVDTSPPVLDTPALDTIVECNGSNNSAQILAWLNNNGGASATDDCSPVFWTNDYGSVNNTCGGSGFVTVIFTASDECGNSISSSATLTINDTTAPTWEIAPADITISCDGTQDPLNQIQSWLDIAGGGEAEDDCSLVIYSDDFMGITGGCSPGTGSATVTFTATDACSNPATAMATVTVIDNTPPTIDTPAQDEIVECDGTGNGGDLTTWLGTNGGAVASDICSDPVSWNNTLLGTEANCGNTTTSTYAFFATDLCGNTSVQTIAQFIIVDNTPPTIDPLPSDEIVECDGSGNIAERNAWLNSNGGALATDVCGGALNWGFVLVNDQDSCGFTGRNTYRFIVIDECGNTSSAEADFVIVDVTPPNLTNPASGITVECDGTNNASEILDWLNDNGGATATDDCGNVTWTNDYGTIVSDCGTTGEVLVTFTATDDCGNSITTSATFTISDTSPPAWEIAPANLTVECDGTNDPLSQIQEWLDNAGGGEAEDSCSLIIYSYVNPGLTGGCSVGTGTAIVTFTATDACGNFTDTTALLSVVDNTPPEIQTPAQDTIVECDGTGNGTDLLSWLGNNGNAAAFDLCSEPLTWNNALINTVAGCGGTSTATYSFTATDECGNVSLETIADFIIVDTEAPVIGTVPTNLTVECDGLGNISDLDTWLMNNGNGVATDVCNDDLNLIWEYDLVSATDSCGTTGSQTYRFTVYDECDNSSTAEAIFVIEDTTNPSIDTGASSLTVQCDGSNNASEILDWLNNNGGAVASDICGDISWTNDYGTIVSDCGTTGEVLVTFTATDDCGNFSQTSATFFIMDDVAPYWEIAPSDLTIECDGTDDPLGQIAAWLDNVGGGEAEDSCSLVIYTNDYTAFTGGCSAFTGSATVTFTATDACGNFTDTTAVITVVDNVPPNIIVPAQDTIVECDGTLNNANDLADWLANIAGAQAEDSCSMITWNIPILMQTIEMCGNTRTLVYSFTADDECGNESAATIASFIIIDTTPPDINTAPSDMTVDCDGQGNEAELDAWLMNNGGGVADDDCEGSQNLTWEYDLVSEEDSCSITGRNLYRFTVYDNCDNSSTAEAYFVIQDTTPPMIIDQAMDMNVECDGTGNESELIDWLNNNAGATATDECSFISWTNNYSGLSDECGATGSATVTFTVSDECGNISQTTATFTVEDNSGPIWEIDPQDLEVECNGSEDPYGTINAWLGSVGGGEAEDTCSFVSYTNNYDFDNMVGGCSEFTGAQEVTFTATDDCGNFTTRTATVSIVDNVPPNIITPAQDTIVECDGNDNMADMTSWLGNIAWAEAEDSCSAITWNPPVLIETIEMCGNTRTFVYSFTADDECGNESAATIASFIIIDTTPPDINTAPSDMTVDCDGEGNEDELDAWLMSNGGGVADDVCEGNLNLTWEYDLVSEEDSCSITGRNLYRFTVYDNCDNSSTAEAYFVIQDTTPPVIIVGAMDITVDCDGANNASEIQDWLNNNGDAEATEECSTVTWTNDYGDINNDCGSAGEVTVTFTATDECGNSSQTSAIFTINDDIPPYWEIAPSDLTIECDGTDDPLGQIQAWLDNVGGGEAEDSCSLVIYTHDYTAISGGCSAFTGSATVTFTATDACGNFTDTTAVISVVDNVPPNIVSPALDTIVECDGMDNPTDLAMWLANIAGAIAEDSCSMITWNPPVLIETIEMCGNTRTFVYSFTADDECGNESAETVANFIIIDTTPPDITTSPMDMVVDCDGQGNEAELDTWLLSNGGGVASDECEGTLNLTWEFDLVSEEDSCTITGRSLYRFTVYDNCDNSSTAEAYFVIQDTTPPVIIVGAMDITVDCDGANNASEIQDWLNNNGDAEATEECSTVTWTNDYGDINNDCGSAGAVTVTFTATDGCGNSSQTSAVFTINDDIPPYWEIAPNDLTIECDGTDDPLGQIQAWLDNVGGGEAEDSCSLVIYTNDYVAISGGCSAFTGSATVTFTATDACGNFTDTTAIITVVDNVPPNITLPAQDTIVECDGMDNATDLADWLANIAGAEAMDSCSMISWNTPILIETIEMCGNTRTFVYSFTADDECGNESAASIASFIIIDTTSPSIDPGASDMVVECDGTGNTAELDLWLADNGGADATDICTDSEALTWEYDLITETDSCGITGSHTYRFTVTDDCGNTSTTEASFIIEDTTAPTINSPAQNITVDCDGANNASEILDWLNNNGGATATDDCGVIVWSNDYGDINNDCGSSGEVTVIFTATDECGNSNTTSAIFTINDDIAPAWEIEPVDLFIECNGDEDPLMQINAWLLTAGGGEAEDSCSLVVYTNDFTELTGGCSDGTGSADVIFTATDACGNAATSLATVSVVDNGMPYFITMAQDTIVECDGDGNTADLQDWLASNGDAVAADACSEPLTWSSELLETEDNCGGTMIYVYAFTATDECDNESPQTIASFIIQDTTPPVFTVLPSGEFIECDDEGIEVTLQNWLDDNGGAEAEDICSEPLTWEYDLVQVLGCGSSLVSTYRFTVFDDCGNTSTAEAEFSIGVESGEPLLTGGEDLFVECDQNNAGNDDELLAWLNDNGGLMASAECLVFTWEHDFDPANWVEDCGATRHIDVTFTATDGCGTEVSETLTFGTVDNTAPEFTNCPRPPIIVDAPSGWCNSFVNFSPVAAIDNCGEVTINQVDNTGLSSGDLFPVGLTILQFEAVDECGNVTEVCDLKIIVNDFHNFPTISCPADLTVETTNQLCGAFVDGIGPIGVSDNCPDNVAVSYVVTNENNMIISCGLEDASVAIFEPGVNTVSYSVQDQPILLMTEVIEDGNISGIEITNFGPASLDISCLNISREGAGDTTAVVPNGTILGVGGIYTQTFDPIDLGTPAGYYISFIERIIDGVSLNGYQSSTYDWSGNLTAIAVLRSRVCDTDTADDWTVSTECNSVNFGFLNNGLPIFEDNGTTTALQSEDPNTMSCSFNITVEDKQDPFCAELDMEQYTAQDLPKPIVQDGCTESIITVDKAVAVWDLNIIDLQGTYPDMLDLTVTLTSPSGTEVVLFNNICAGTSDFNVNFDDQASDDLSTVQCGPLGQGDFYQPFGTLKDFFGEDAQGNWKLKILNTTDNSGELTNWIIELAALIPYSQENVELENDLGQCGAQYNWVAPVFGDNCCSQPNITVEYSSNDNINVPPSGDVVAGGNVSAFFEVGTTTVKYTLMDDAGNVSMCSFDVTVVDAEAPQIGFASCNDITIDLDPGECSTFTSLNPAQISDNCNIANVEYSPDPADGLPVGDTEVTLTVTDDEGNSASCTFTITVVDFDPGSDQLVCNDEVNISLGPDCQTFITADMILEGGPYGCLDEFCITLEDQWGQEIGNSEDGTNMVGEEHVGMAITVTICTSCDDGENCCWGIINVEQKLIPEIDCPSDTIVECNVPLHPSNLGYPELLSCEEQIYISYYDEFVDLGACENPRAQITRLWTIEDESGNVVECIQNITVADFDLNEIVYPDDIEFENALDCYEVANDPSLIHPDNTGYPMINDIVISETGEGLCMHSWNWDDQILYSCDGSYEILRKWIIRDMCEPVVPGVNPIEEFQIIKILDLDGPEFSTCPEDITIPTDVWNCYASIDISDLIPEVTDLCGGVSELQVFVNQGTVVQDQNDPMNVQLTNLLPGEHLVKIRAKDFCSNFSVCEFNITVEDQIPPIAICDDELRISLTAGGNARVFPEDLDEGSFDNCDPVFLQVYRLTDGCGTQEFTTPGPYVDFCCEDLLEDSIQVVLRVWDDGDNNGEYGTAGDNYSECWTYVVVEEKIPPIIVCPEDMTINCLDSWQSIIDGNGQDLTGEPLAIAICETSVPSYTVNGSVDDCGYGTLNLIWTVTTGSGLTQGCLQTITVMPETANQLTCDRISFPAGSPEAITYGPLVWCEVNDNQNDPDDDQPAIQITDCGDFTITEPELDNNSLCSAIGINMTADTFNFAGGACQKIIVHWEIIDQCLFDENYVDPNTGEIDPFNSDNGYFEFFAEYDIFDTEAPVLDCIESIVINCTDVFTGPIVGMATDNCTDPSEFGWSWAFDYSADGSIDHIGTGAEITAAALGLPYIELGDHRIIWSVNDGCGNNTTQSCIVNISDEDTKAPTPYCYDGIATAVMQESGEITIWATDFDAGSFDDCTDQEDLIFSFSGENLQASTTYTCDSIPNGISVELEVAMWVWDAAGNRDFCTVSLLLQDNLGSCPDDNTQTAEIAGIVLTETGLPVNEVNIELSSVAGEFPKFDITEEDGNYSFTSNPYWYEYLLSPEKDIDYLNGVSTLDIILIQKHVLGIEVLDSPYKIIAADATNDLKVSALDLLVIRKLLLGFIDELPDNKSWRFVDADQEFSDELDPFPFPEQIEILQLDNESLMNDFIAIKIGDVNQTAEANLQDISAEVRNVDPFVFNVKTIENDNGTTVLEYYASEQVSLEGFQFTLNLSDNEFIKFESGLINLNASNYSKDDEQNLIALSWNPVNSILISPKERLFSIVCNKDKSYI